MQIPYQTNKATLVEKIAELVEDKVSLFGADLVAWLVNLSLFCDSLRFYQPHDASIKISTIVVFLCAAIGRYK